VNIQVWMMFEENPKQIPCLSLIPVNISEYARISNKFHIPVSTSEHSRSTRNRIRLPSISLDPNPPSMARTDAQQMVYHLKPLLPLWVIHTTNVHDALELALRVISKESENRDHGRRRDVESQFILQDRELLDEFGEALD